MLNTDKKVEIFSGTGGVGKTTLATSRAVFLAKQNKKVLLITIDPSKRLKEVLHLQDKENGEIEEVSLNQVTFHAMLMSTKATIQNIANHTDFPAFKENRIVEVLSRPNGGLNEILSLVELNFQLESEAFDTIVLDTPPGSHFLDFLESSEKIESFFDKKFIEIFKHISEKESVKSKSRFAMNLISTGVNKLISYLEKVTGSSFIKEFTEAVSVIYKTKDTFLNSLNLKKKLKDPNYAHWFLVTSASQDKLKEALKLYDGAGRFLSSQTITLINKCLEEHLSSWSPEKKELQSLKSSYLVKEQELKKEIKSHFKKVCEFQEIANTDPQEQIKILTQNWSTF